MLQRARGGGVTQKFQESVTPPPLNSFSVTLRSFVWPWDKLYSMCRALGALAVDTDCGTMAVGSMAAVKRCVTAVKAEG